MTPPTELNRHAFPPGGWVFVQPQTGWRAPTPTSSTFDQTVQLIRQHRLGNPAAVTKHRLATDVTAIEAELENFTRARLHMKAAPPPPPKTPPSSRAAGVVGVVAEAGRSLVGDLLKAAQGSAVVLDWLRSGGAPVSQELANARAATCAACPKNVAGRWFTENAAEAIRETLEARKDLKLETPHDAVLKSCDVCLCLNRLKVWCPMVHIMKSTKPKILSEFPQNCWIAKRE